MNKYHGTVKEFLEAGHRFVEGDLRTLLNGSVWPIEESDLAWVNNFDEWRCPDDSYVVYAACLNKEPELEYELVPFTFERVWEAVKAVEEDGIELFGANGMPYFHPLKVVDQISKGNKLYRHIPLRTKTATYPMPETKAPEKGAEYFSATANGIVLQSLWNGRDMDFRRLKAGNVFLKREHAKAKADAQAVEIEE